MKLRFLFAVLALVFLLMVGTVACGGDDDTSSPTAPGQDGGDDDDDGGDDDESSGEPTLTIPPNFGEELSLEEYFATIDGIFDGADAATETAQGELDAALASELDLDAQIDAIQGYLDTELTVFSDAIGGLDILNPPDELDADHDAFIAAVTEAAEAASQLQFALDDVETEEEADELIQEFEETVTGITDRSDEACLGLQAVADANSIAVDLDCED